MSGEIEQGREAYERKAWRRAYELLLLADRVEPLGGDDLERLATAAYLSGEDDAHVRSLERAHNDHLQTGDRLRAARCAFWAGLMLFLRGETGQGSGWLARAQRLVEGLDCAEGGYLLLPVAEQQLAEGSADAARSTAVEAAGIGSRFGEADLVAAARHLEGRALIRKGQLSAGLMLLDEAMLAAIAGELSPIMTGLIYCSLIEACQGVYELKRAREWTGALARWCEKQPQMVAFTATCLVHRAQVLVLAGDWSDAMAEARRACESSSREGGRNPPAGAWYQQAELERLRGDFAAAERSYREASRAGREPQPGLALLRMAQGRTDAANAAIRRILSATTDPLKRANLLPAHTEIMLAAGDLREADRGCSELEKIAERFDSEALRAMSAQGRGAVSLAKGDAGAALASLSRALELWRRVEAPYETARVRVQIGMACGSLGDEEAAGLELDAARAVFERLGAEPDLVRLDSIRERPAAAQQHPLTARELQVLRLIAAGRTNKAIAAELFLSERTIDRHVSNILTKLGVPSRAAAISHAYEQKLL
jgi:ATP/maltotriose-dependent transcriptional regulator MalT